MAGSPQALVPGEFGLVSRNSVPPRLTGRIAPSSVQNWESAPLAGSTSRDELQALAPAKMQSEQANAAKLLIKVHNGTG